MNLQNALFMKPEEAEKRLPPKTHDAITKLGRQIVDLLNNLDEPDLNPEEQISVVVSTVTTVYLQVFGQTMEQLKNPETLLDAHDGVTLVLLEKLEKIQNG